jgi:hypothetical protein
VPRDLDADDAFEEAVLPAPRVASTFGAVWDSQIGVPTASAGRPPARTPQEPFDDDDEDLDEPPIPEYLIAERRQRSDAAGGRGRGGRGRGGAYAAAMDRERFGGGRGSQVSRYAEPGSRRDSGPNRFDRDRGDRGGFRASRPESRPAPRPVSSDEPWSEVPPELEAMLRAQLSGGAGRAAARPAPRADRTAPSEAAPAPTAEAEAPAAAPKPRRGRTAAAATTGHADAPEAPKRRATRTKAAVPPVDAGTAEVAGSDAAGGGAEAAPKAPRRTSTRSTRTKAADAPAESGEPVAAAPKRRARKTADPAS